VPGTITYNNSTLEATFTPASQLFYGTQYTATITAVTDSAGNSLATPKVWSFTTQTLIASVSPTNGASDVSKNTTVNAVFNSAMDNKTITQDNFTLRSANQNVTGTVSYDTATRAAIFHPAVPLSGSTAYTATVSNNVRDINGATMVTSYSWTFTTGTSSTVVNLTIPGNIQAGGEFVVTIAISKVTDLASYQFRLTYDPTVLQLDNRTFEFGIEPGKVGNVTFASPNLEDSGPGWVKYGVMLSSDPYSTSGGGYLAKVHFKALKAGQSALTFLDDINKLGFHNFLFDSYSNVIAADWINGTVTIN
jgi:hypothetical protein